MVFKVNMIYGIESVTIFTVYAFIVLFISSEDARNQINV